ncbi:hypothetical protein [Parasitella parasitica]|uniref:Integrase catalytic domain-containing protein n=1 Tax=Parasitella parasitica TaxID=35722 RepID=A0A0B7NGM8_9FUNG|nr:hypothetical protein [Parasitella parasitica]
MRILLELLVQNSQIDMKNNACNLPDSVIKLDVIPGSVSWRAEYPLPEAYREIVAKQIKIWLDEGVIVRSASHTRFNHPLLVVKQKDADGNYSIDKSRVVCDVRKLNSILVVDDEQQLPLISTIHQSIGTKTIHTCPDTHACFTSFALEPSQAPRVNFTCPFTNVQYTHAKAAYGIRHVESVVVRGLQSLLSDLSTSPSTSSPFPTNGCYRAECYVDDVILSSNGSLEDHFELVAELEEQELILRTLKFSDYITPPASDRDNMIISQHLVGHFGIKHVENAIHKEGFHWKNIRKDIERILADCIECSRYNIAKEGYHPFRSPKADKPLDHWCMDLGDMGVTSSFGNNFIFVLTDYFARFTVKRCIPDKHATTIAREMLQVFSLFGWPKQLTSDRGAEWVNEVVNTMMEISGIDKRLSLAYNPLGNSTSESFIKLTKSTTIKLLKGKRDHWEHYIPWVNYCINVKYARLHKSRPYTLLFNRQPNGPTDYSKVEPTPVSEFADDIAVNKHYQFVQDFLIPAISKRILETQNTDHAYFAKSH